MSLDVGHQLSQYRHCEICQIWPYIMLSVGGRGRLYGLGKLFESSPSICYRHFRHYASL